MGSLRFHDFDGAYTRRRLSSSRARRARQCIGFLLWVSLNCHAGGWQFSDVTLAAGAASTHGLQFGPFGEPDMMSGGVAAGDIDGDGWPELLVLRGDLGAARLLVNLRNGRFREEGAARGLAINTPFANGALLADVDGDGDLDVLVGSLYIPDPGLTPRPRLWRNDGSGQFAEDTTFLPDWDGRDSWSMALADLDGDRDLDLAIGRWNRDPGTRNHLFRQQAGQFVADDAGFGLAAAWTGTIHSFTPNFADIDGDGDPDLLMTSDFGTSRVFRNTGGVLADITTPAISDENGMGAAVGDYDNDGDLDWFVSSIHDSGVPAGNWGSSGNRLYRNEGNGQFTDVTELAGVREAGWGWGSCFADFDADGWLDLYVVNGMMGIQAAPFHADTARLFVNQRDGTFLERAAELGVADTGQGRGIACFDHDRDGDVDLYVQNGYGAARLYRNDLPSPRAVTMRLQGASPNAGAIGARVVLNSSGGSQLRELSAGNHFLSGSPPEAHFGLGAATLQSVEVRWPDGRRSRLGGPAPGPLWTVSIDQISSAAFE